MKKIIKKKKISQTEEERLCKKFETDLAAHKAALNNRVAKIKFYESVGLMCFAALTTVAVYNHNYAASLCLIPDVWAMYKLFKMI